MEIPEVRFAESDGLRIAYQAFGSGPPLVLIPPLVSNVEVGWEHEIYRRTLEYLGRHLRVVLYDKRGIGLSERFEEMPTLEHRIRDTIAVLDAEEIERASLLGLSEGGLMSQLFAAACPDRIDKLVLVNSVVPSSAIGDDAFKAAFDSGPFGGFDGLLANFAKLVETWAVDPSFLVNWFAPSQRDNEGFVRWMGRLERLSATRADMQRQLDSILLMSLEQEAGVLDKIDAPTLVMHVSGDRVLPVGLGKRLAERIRDAQYVELAGEDHFTWVMDSWRELADRVIEFVTGTPVAPRQTRRFAVVMFTDIVDSTATATRMGDATWHETLDSHDRIARHTTDKFGGRVVKSTGDGLLVVFDTPSLAATCAGELRRRVAEIGLAIRVGLHAGEVQVRDDGDVAGLAVHVAARVEQQATRGEILVSSMMRELLLGSEFTTTDAGEHDLKGVDGRWRLYALA